MMNNYNITNAQILSYINNKLFSIQNDLRNTNIDKQKNSKNSVIVKAVAYLLIGTSIVLISSVLLGPISSIGSSLLLKLVAPTLVGVAGAGTAIFGNRLSSLVDAANKKKNILNSEAIELQNVREYLEGKITLTNEINNYIELLKKQIYENEITGHIASCQKEMSESMVKDYSNSKAIQTPFTVTGENTASFINSEYHRLRYTMLKTPADIINEISRGVYSQTYNDIVLKELYRIAILEMAQKIYDFLINERELSASEIIGKINDGSLRNLYNDQILAEVMNIAIYNQQIESTKTAV